MREFIFKSLLSLVSNQVLRVDYFVDQNTVWDFSWLRERFLLFDCTNIPDIPLAVIAQDNSLPWFFDPKGFFQLVLVTNWLAYE